jgi:hypothetical protein
MPRKSATTVKEVRAFSGLQLEMDGEVSDINSSEGEEENPIKKQSVTSSEYVP